MIIFNDFIDKNQLNLSLKTKKLQPEPFDVQAGYFFTKKMAWMKYKDMVISNLK